MDRDAERADRIDARDDRPARGRDHENDPRLRLRPREGAEDMPDVDGRSTARAGGMAREGGAAPPRPPRRATADTLTPPPGRRPARGSPLPTSPAREPSAASQGSRRPRRARRRRSSPTRTLSKVAEPSRRYRAARTSQRRRLGRRSRGRTPVREERRGPFRRERPVGVDADDEEVRRRSSTSSSAVSPIDPIVTRAVSAPRLPVTSSAPTFWRGEVRRELQGDPVDDVRGPRPWRRRRSAGRRSSRPTPEAPRRSAGCPGRGASPPTGGNLE